MNWFENTIIRIRKYFFYYNFIRKSLFVLICRPRNSSFYAVCFFCCLCCSPIDFQHWHKFFEKKKNISRHKQENFTLKRHWHCLGCKKWELVGEIYCLLSAFLGWLSYEIRNLFFNILNLGVIKGFKILYKWMYLDFFHW